MSQLSAFDDLWKDVTYGARLLIRNPGFTAVAVLALALGIGINAMVFTLANAVLYKSQPFDDNNRILYMFGTDLSRADSQRPLSYPDFRDFRSQSKSFESMGAISNRGVEVSDKNGLPDRYSGTALSANSFSLIGQRPMLGRDFLPEDERPGAPPVVILSASLWKSRYGEDPSTVGKSIRLNGVATQVIGVMPVGLRFPAETELWMPLIPTPDWEKRDFRTLAAFGRMTPTATVASVRAEMNTIAQRLAAAYPDTNKNGGIRVMTFNERFNGSKIRAVFTAMLGAVGFVLLIACANVANLLLSRAVGRTREISIRAALGAGRWRVIRQLLVESVMLATVGGALGWLTARWGVQAFDKAVAGIKPPYVDFSVDYRVILYLVAVTFVTGILFGLAPALQLSRMDINVALKEGGTGAGHGSRGRWLSGLLVVTEMALAVVLLAGAGLMVRSFMKVYHTDIGMNSAGVLTLQLNLRDTKYPKSEEWVQFHQRLKLRLDALPGVEATSVASDLPTDGFDQYPYEIEGAPPVDPKNRPQVGGLVIGADYFRVVQVTPRLGRVFTEADGAGSVPVVIVNRRAADKFWPQQDALGKRLRIIAVPPNSPRGTAATPQAWLNVVGVVPDILQDDNTREFTPLIYMPYSQQPQNNMVVMARTVVPPSTLGDAVRREVQTADEDLAVRNLRTLDEFLRLRGWPYRVFGSMFAIFAGIALMLASVGLYAVIAHSVSQRTREIGIRMALGASTANVLGLVFKQGMLRLGIGLLVGLAAAFGVTRVLSGLLVGVTATDPTTFAIVALILTLAGALGCGIPARRAMRVDPVVALRYE
jgi:predicted permease